MAETVERLERAGWRYDGVRPHCNGLLGPWILLRREVYKGPDQYWRAEIAVGPFGDVVVR